MRKSIIAKRCLMFQMFCLPVAVLHCLQSRIHSYYNPAQVATPIYKSWGMFLQSRRYKTSGDHLSSANRFHQNSALTSNLAAATRNNLLKTNNLHREQFHIVSLVLFLNILSITNHGGASSEVCHHVIGTKNAERQHISDVMFYS